MSASDVGNLHKAKDPFESAILDIINKIDEVFIDEVAMLYCIDESNTFTKGDVIKRLREDHECIREKIDYLVKELERSLQYQTNNCFEIADVPTEIEQVLENDYIDETGFVDHKPTSNDVTLSSESDVIILNQHHKTFNKLISWWKIHETKSDLVEGDDDIDDQLEAPSKSVKTPIEKSVNKKQLSLKNGSSSKSLLRKVYPCNYGKQ